MLEYYVMTVQDLPAVMEIENAEYEFDISYQLSKNLVEDFNTAVALTFEQNKQYSTALKYFQLALLESPKSTFLLAKAGQMAEKAGNSLKALAFYRAYLEENTDNARIWYNGWVPYEKEASITEAIEAYEFATAIKPSFSNAVFNKASLYYRKNEFTKAAESYTEYLKWVIRDVPATCYAGDAYAAAQKYEKAEHFYKKTLDYNGNYVSAWQGIAEIYFMQGKYENSMPYIDKAIQLEPEKAEYRYLAAISLIGFGQLDAASENFSKAITTEPKNYRYWLEYSDMLHEFKSVKRAEEALRTALTVIPDSPQVLYRLAAYLLTDDRKEEAAYTLKSAIAKAPELSHYFTSFNEEVKPESFLENVSSY